MKKLILIASLLMAGGLWAGEGNQICQVYDEDASRCIKGDSLVIREGSHRVFTNLILQYCETETIVVLSDNHLLGEDSFATCIYTGETRATREYCGKKCQKKKNKNKN
jgi:hypothetical protein